MPRSKKSFVEEAQELVNSEPDFCVRGERIWCTVCKEMFKCRKITVIRRHLVTQKHERNKSMADSAAAFNYDLTEMLTNCNIPLNVCTNPSFKSFFRKYIPKHTIPHPSTITNNLTPLYNRVIENVRRNIANHYVWISVDETSDKFGRHVTNFIVGKLDGTPSTPYLLCSKHLETVNHQTITQFVNECIEFLYDGVVRENISKVLCLVTDGASHMIKAGNNLRSTFPDLIHVTCLAHALHLLTEKIRSSFPDVNELITIMKDMFVRAPARIRL